MSEWVRHLIGVLKNSISHSLCLLILLRTSQSSYPPSYDILWKANFLWYKYNSMFAFISGNMMGRDRVKEVGDSFQRQFHSGVQFIVWIAVLLLLPIYRWRVTWWDLQTRNLFYKIIYLLQLNRTWLKRFLEEGQIACFLQSDIINQSKFNCTIV